MKEKSRRWCLRFDLAMGEKCLVGIRVEETAEVAVSKNDVWLRLTADEDLLPSLRKLPFADWFEEHGNGELVPLEAALPVECLPPGLKWQPLVQWLRPAQATTLLPAKVNRKRVPLQLVRETNRVESANLMQITFSSLAQWVERAPQSRLEPLEWMADSLGLVFVRGDVLPPVPGEYLLVEHGVARPLGFRVFPAMSSAALRSLVGAASTDLVVIKEKGIRRVPEEFFVPLTRSGVRMTRERFCLLEEQV